jgi:hypothetical protein
MLPTPNVEASPAWAESWTGFHLDMQFTHRSINTIANRRCNVSIMAKHALTDGEDPAPRHGDYLGAGAQ